MPAAFYGEELLRVRRSLEELAPHGEGDGLVPSTMDEELRHGNVGDLRKAAEFVACQPMGRDDGKADPRHRANIGKRSFYHQAGGGEIQGTIDGDRPPQRMTEKDNASRGDPLDLDEISESRPDIFEEPWLTGTPLTPAVAPIVESEETDRQLSQMPKYFDPLRKATAIPMAVENALLGTRVRSPPTVELQPAGRLKPTVLDRKTFPFGMPILRREATWGKNLTSLEPAARVAQGTDGTEGSEDRQAHLYNSLPLLPGLCGFFTHGYQEYRLWSCDTSSSRDEKRPKRRTYSGKHID